jgi:hypothetical protein
MFGMLARSAADNKVGFLDRAVPINKYSSTYSTKYSTKYITKYITKFRAVNFHTFFHTNLHTKCKVNYLYSILLSNTTK